MLYFGGKHFLKRRIIPLLPRVDTVVSPFLGGAKIEIELAKRGVQVIANDADTAVINVWRNFQERKDELLGRLEETYLNPSEEHREELLAEYKEEGFLDGLESAAKYLALNPSIVNGKMNRKCCCLKTKLTLFDNGNQRRSYFHMGLLNQYARLDYRPFKLYNEDWETFINRQDQSLFSYLDPPYLGVLSGAYQHEFHFYDHLRLYRYLADRDHFALSYKNHKQILEWYDTERFSLVAIDYHNPSKNSTFQTGTNNVELLISPKSINYDQVVDDG